MGEFRITYHPANDAANEFSQLPFQNLTERILEVAQGLEIPEIAENLSVSVTAMEQYSKFTKLIAATLLSISESYFSAERTATEGFNELEQLANAVVKQAEHSLTAGNSPPAESGTITNPGNSGNNPNETPPNAPGENSNSGNGRENSNINNDIILPTGNISTPPGETQTPDNDAQPDSGKAPWVAIWDAIFGITAPGYSTQIAAAVAAIIGLGITGGTIAAVTKLIQSILDSQLVRGGESSGTSGGSGNTSASGNNSGANSDDTATNQLQYATGSGITALPQGDTQNDNDLANNTSLSGSTGLNVNDSLSTAPTPSVANSGTNMYEAISELGTIGGVVGAGVATFGGSTTNKSGTATSGNTAVGSSDTSYSPYSGIGTSVTDNAQEVEAYQEPQNLTDIDETASVNSENEYQPHTFSDSSSTTPQDTANGTASNDAERNSTSPGAIPIVGAVGAAAMAGTGFEVSKSGSGSKDSDTDIDSDKAVEIAATKSGGTFSGDLSGSYVLLTTALSMLFSGGSIGAGVRKSKDLATDGFRIGYGNSAVINADSIKQRWG
ncbi:MAG: hypothetical protein LBN97_04210 [Oscillospiraceae bacterium]|jgi:hypothetical protein|nr:hypothetical protein [Oscillospiraceae bacterium]